MRFSHTFLMPLALISGSALIASTPAFATSLPVDPGKPDPGPRPDPSGCRKACGSKSCCQAHGTGRTKMRIKRKLRGHLQDEGTIGEGSGGPAGLGGTSPKPPHVVHCHPGQGVWCPD